MLVGSISVTAPEIDITARTFGNTEKLFYPEVSGGGVAYNVGGGLRANLSPNWAFRASAEMIGGTASIERQLDYKLNSGATQTTKTKSDYDVSTFNFNIGIAYQFMPKK